MPIIVPIEENNVGLASATDARFRAADYSGSGLQALGSGLTDVGKGGAQLAEALDEQRTHRDDAAIKQAYVGFGNQADPLLHGYFSLSGSAARTALPQVEADLQAAGQAQIDGVGNDRRRAMIAQQITQRVAESVAAARSHAGLQDIADQAQQNRSLQDRSIKDALNNIDRPELYEHHIETGKNGVRQQARLAGQPPAQAEAAAHGYQSGIHLTHIDTRAADDAVGALVAVRRHGSDMRPDDMRKALTGIAPRFSYERAIADVDAADLAASPFAPQAPRMSADDLRDRMLVISPDTQQGNLPSLLQRYRGDAARSWAAAAMGPDKLDALIAQRGDGWYQALPQPVLLDVAQHMALLGARASTRALPSNPTAVATRIVDQPGIDDERRQHALDELNWRLVQDERSRREMQDNAASHAFTLADQHGPAFTSIAQIPPALRRELRSADMDVLMSRARSNINPPSAVENASQNSATVTPALFGSAATSLANGDRPASAFAMHPAAFLAGGVAENGSLFPDQVASPATPVTDGAAGQAASPATTPGAGTAPDPAKPPTPTTAAPLRTATVGRERILAASIAPADVARLSGENIIATPEMRAAAQAQINKVRVASGDKEILAFAYLMPDGTIDVRPGGTAGSGRNSDNAHGSPTGPGKLLFIIHGHIESDFSGNPADDGMVDAPDDPKSEGRGDSDGLFKYHVPVATVYGNKIGWRELHNGQLTFSVPLNAQTPRQLNDLETRLTKEQPQFFKPLPAPTPALVPTPAPPAH
jgi:hypothetical protein